MKILQPPAWPKPMGFSQGIAATGRLVFDSGQIGWDETETIVSDDFVAQAKQGLRSGVAGLAVAGGGPNISCG